MRASKMQGRNARQSGLALITALIMLVVLTLLVLAGINMTNVNTKIAYNIRQRRDGRLHGKRADSGLRCEHADQAKPAERVEPQ